MESAELKKLEKKVKITGASQWCRLETSLNGEDKSIGVCWKWQSGESWLSERDLLPEGNMCTFSLPLIFRGMEAGRKELSKDGVLLCCSVEGQSASPAKCNELL